MCILEVSDGDKLVVVLWKSDGRQHSGSWKSVMSDVVVGRNPMGFVPQVTRTYIYPRILVFSLSLLIGPDFYFSDAMSFVIKITPLIQLLTTSCVS